MSIPDPAIARIAAGLARTRKYSHLCEETLERVAGWALDRYPGEKEALKAAKTKLHQVYGAYTAQLDMRQLRQAIAEIPSSAEPEGVRRACRRILESHVSTAERLGFQDELYPVLFGAAGMPRSIADLCCGLHPFSLPWMPIDSTVRYHAFDIDRDVSDALNDFFELLGRPRLAECRDILVSTPEVAVDLALVLKALPCLEQQERGVSRRLLEEIRAPRIIVSFPTASIGGRSKEMYAHYGKFIQDAAGRLGTLTEYRFPNETFYLLEKS